MSRLIWIYAVCKIILLSPMAVKELTLSMLGNKSIRRHFQIFFLLFFFQEIGFDFFGDNLHEMSKPIFCGKKKKIRKNKTISKYRI